MSWADVAAAPAVIEQLQRSLRHGRLAHAYLFTGPRGSGKQEAALTLAKSLNCAVAEHDSCDRCDSCRRIANRKHPDLYWVSPESKSRRITVEQVREFCRAINLKPHMAAVKVGVIVDADCLREEASNAFLKTLEEPPAQTIIVLLTAEPQRLLPTILSRCLRLSFEANGTPSASPYRERLVPLLAQFAAQQRAAGRVPAAYGLATQLTALLAEERTRIRTELEDGADWLKYGELDAKQRDRLTEQLEARIEGEYWAAREKVLEDLYRWFADVLLCVRGADETLLEYRAALGELRVAAAGLTEVAAFAQLAAVEQMRDWLSRNIPESQALEVGALQLARGAEALR